MMAEISELDYHRPKSHRFWDSRLMLWFQARPVKQQVRLIVSFVYGLSALVLAVAPLLVHLVLPILGISDGCHTMAGMYQESGPVPVLAGLFALVSIIALLWSLKYRERRQPLPEVPVAKVIPLRRA